MMDSGEIYVLDVGHGNCAIVRTPDGVVVVDAPSEPVVATMLDSLNIDRIHTLIVSHADSDHLSGAVALLMNERRPVGSVHVNPDRRDTEVWRRFRVAAKRAVTGGTKIHSVLNHEDPGEFQLGETTFHVLHPTVWGCLATADGKDLQGARQNPNSMSGIVMIKHRGQPVCLLAGDADSTSLASMVEQNADLNADVLVFPHHGGHSARGRSGMERRQQNLEFARDLSKMVSPELVLFSLGRGRHRTPQPEIVAGISEGSTSAGAAAYLACTQLSASCSTDLTGGARVGLDLRSAGAPKGMCCSGTLGLPLDRDARALKLREFRAEHSEFVDGNAKTPLCRRQKPDQT